MRGFNHITIAGNLTRDPEIRATTSGAQVCNFSVAVNYYSGKNNQDEVMYFRCACWGKRGETIQQYIHKGDAILVSGRLTQDKWTNKEGHEQTTLEIAVDDFAFLNGKNRDDSMEYDDDLSTLSADTPQPKTEKKKKSGSKKVEETENIPDDIPEGEISLDEVPF